MRQHAHRLAAMGLASISLTAVLLAGREQAPPVATAAGFDVTEKSIAELQDAITRGAVTSRQLVDGYLARIEAYDQAGPALNAFISLNPRALETADALDRERRERGPRGLLHGIPIVVKDNYDTADMPTTGSSIALATHQPAGDAFQVQRLREAGAIIIGKTNLHELAAGILTVSSLGGQTRNPYDPTRNPGGSSGGTGAAVAASFAAAGMGTDTCGSIRIPAAHNNLVGLRPTMGLSSRAGVIPLALTQDVAGPLGRSVADVAVMLDATVGYDPRDPVTEAGRDRVPASYVAALEGATLRGVRIGVLRALFGNAEADAEFAGLVRGALERMRAAGAEVVEVEIPDLSDLQRGSSVIDYEFKFDLTDYLAAAPAPPVRSLGEILERGLHHAALTSTFRRRNAVESRDSEPYRAALARRDALRQAVLAAMETHGVATLAYPTMRRRAARIGESQSGSTCQLSAATALPALAMPAAFADDGLPVGLELLGQPFAEVELLRIAAAFEQLGAVRRPPPTTPPLPVADNAIPTRFQASTATATARNSPPGVTASFHFDAARGVLAFEVQTSGIDAADMLLGAIRAGANGPIVGRLLRTGQTLAVGELPLTDANRDALAAGQLIVQLFTRQSPLGGASAPVVATRLP
jgi:Asp-tRNA(Asn)/Glu-tRNA(Gln) amidotransferase A subunit family amidase